MVSARFAGRNWPMRLSKLIASAEVGSRYLLVDGTPRTGRGDLKTMRKVRPAAVVFGSCLLVAVLALSTAPPAAGQLELPPLLPTPGSTPPPLLPGLLPGILAPPSPTPGVSPTAAPSAQATQAPADTDSDLGEYARCGGPPPPIARGKRTGPRNTKKLIEEAQPLVERGVPLDQALIALAPPFPVAGKATFTDDWGNPRYSPCPHWHQGTDIFAAFGTPIVASGPGVVIARGRHPVGGLSVWVTGDDKMAFYYAHLQSFGDVKAGDRVEAGTVLGYVGDTGNAEGGSPHLHFSIHPPTRSAYGIRSSNGAVGSSVTPYANPKPYLDAWLTMAETRAPRAVAQVERELDADPTAANRVLAILRAGEVAGFGDAPGTGPFGLPWSKWAILAGVLGAVAVSQSFFAITRTARERRTSAAELAGVEAWSPSWALKTSRKRGRRGQPSSGAWPDPGQTPPRFQVQDYSAPERPPGLR
jgi:murein DD-endopeptidase MepM/ murein hydrolase activator NlpD